MNSVNRVNHGCNPSELLIGPMIKAKFISGIVDSSINKFELEKKTTIQYIEFFYWYNNDRLYQFE